MNRENTVGFQIKIIHDGINRCFGKMNSNSSLTLAQFAVLHYLDEHSEQQVFVKDLVSYLQLEQSSVSILIKRMEDNGYVNCIPDTQDRRQKTVILNQEKSLQILKKARENAKQMDEKLMHGLSVAEEKELNRLLGIVADNLSRI